MRIPIRTSALPGDDHQLWPHQVKALKLSLKHPKFGLFMEQRTGKTVVVLGSIGARFLVGKVKRVLVFTTKSTVYSWVYWAQRLLNLPVQVVPLMGSERQRSMSLRSLKGSDLQIAVTNYTSALSIKEKLIAWAPDMVVVDEAHHLKSYKSKQGRAIAKIAKDAPFRIALTGTPIIKNQLDIFGIYRFLDEHIFGSNFFKFRNKYAVMGGYMGKQVKGIQNERDLHRKMYSIAYRVTLKEALPYLPPVLPPEVLYTDLEPEATRIYEEMEKEAVAQILDAGEIMAPIVLTKLLRLSQITGGFVGTEDGTVAVSGAKLGLLAESLEDTLVDITKKVVVFARFTPEIDAIMNLCQEARYHPLKIDGSVKGDRFKIERAFRENPHRRVLVCQIAAGGEGLDFSAADTEIFYSPDYSYGNYYQARARCLGSNQKFPVRIVHLMVRGSIDEDVFDAIQDKRDIAEIVVDRLRANYGHPKEAPWTSYRKS